MPESKVRIEIPSDLELSEEEMRKVASATENQIVEVIRGKQAKKLSKRIITPNFGIEFAEEVQEN